MARHNQPPPFPTLFVLAASHAMIGHGSVLETHEAQLADAARLVAPIISFEGLITRDRDLPSTAIDFGDRRSRSNFRPTGRETTALLMSVRMDSVYDGLFVGLAAGYLLAQVVAGKDGAR